MSSTRNGFPQFNVVLKATQRYVDSPEEMAAFDLTEPGWIDWSQYDQSAIGHFVLFNNEKALLNYDQVQKALGWDGASLAALAAGDWAEKEVLFTMEENTYEGNTTIRPNWIDHVDASPTRGLQALDPTALKDLDSKFKGFMKSAPKAAPAKAGATPPGKAAVTPPGKPAVVGTAAKPTVPAAQTKVSQSPAAPTTAKPPQKTAPKPTVKPTPQKETIPFDAALATETDQTAAWAAVTERKGSLSDDTLATLWIDACEAIAPGMTEEAITPAQWAQVRDTVLSKFVAAAA